MLDRSGLNLPCRPLFSWDYEPRIWFYMLSVIYDTGVFLAGKGPNPCTANIHKGLKRRVVWEPQDRASKRRLRAREGPDLLMYVLRQGARGRGLPILTECD